MSPRWDWAHWVILVLILLCAFGLPLAALLTILVGRI